uniref:Uncharacterized protein LOC110209459 n=1 Tax=Phascolarctos cinereus TaxID=38626 RepID=A0A6P5KDL2_PHACI|nr:uncharacterized protein LOC110209459 [Phascolarctos cinereus]
MHGERPRRGRRRARTRSGKRRRKRRKRSRRRRRGPGGSPNFSNFPPVVSASHLDYLHLSSAWSKSFHSGLAAAHTAAKAISSSAALRTLPALLSELQQLRIPSRAKYEFFCLTMKTLHNLVPTSLLKLYSKSSLRHMTLTSCMTLGKSLLLHAQYATTLILRLIKIPNFLPDSVQMPPSIQSLLLGFLPPPPSSCQSLPHEITYRYRLSSPSKVSAPQNQGLLIFLSFLFFFFCLCPGLLDGLAFCPQSFQKQDGWHLAFVS